MILDGQGKPTASDGPTGRQFNCMEVCKDGKRSWAVIIPSGKVPIDADEMISVMSLLIHTIAQQIRAHAAQAKVGEALKTLNKE